MKLIAAVRYRLLEGQPLSSLSPAITAPCTLLLCGAALLVGRQPRIAPAAPLAGILYSAATESPAAAALGEAGPPAPAPSYPEIRLSVSPAARSSFPQGSDFIAHIVPPAASTFTVTLAHSTAPPAPRLRRAAREVQVSTAPLAAQEPPPAVPEPTPPPAPPVATQATSFVELDEALRGSPTTETVNLRLKRSGVTFRATHVGRLGDRAAIRFAIANEESSDFFLSIVSVWADSAPIHSETAGPYACGAGREIFGVVHFAGADAAGKRVAIELVQSGGERRRFKLALDHRF